MKNNDFIAACIIPTGIGASIGGYAGDASPYINLLSKVCPVITNPNSVNAAIFSGINDNILYMEGYAIDMFFKEEIALSPSKFNKIGVIFDKAIPEKVLNVHINTINSVKSTYGINILGYELTEEEAGVDFNVSESGISTGELKNPDTLINSARKLIDKGAEAIAVVCYFDTPDDFDYANGSGIDPVGGVEAVISHILTREFNVPVAHAPAFDENSLIISSEIVNKKAAAEYITPTFLPCILLGLYNAPKIIENLSLRESDITLKNIKALVIPYDCMGGLPVLKAIEKNIPVIAVEENKTVLNIIPELVGIVDKVIKVKNYQEAAGYLLAMKNGIYF
ncbi:MAG: hypothetical protein A2039_04240 [Candidatus Melainabacteria bacterium GWA2_34_9]|nr:MAG: hypothetical protein A2039_04240 [Candidatus Melainabacteria bacterium GWA2_34_9]